METPHPPEAVLEAFAEWLQEWAEYTRAYSAWLKDGREGDDEGAPADPQTWASPAAGEPPDHWLEAAGSAGPPAHWLALFEKQAEAFTGTESPPGSGTNEGVGPPDPGFGSPDPGFGSPDPVLEQPEARRAEPEAPGEKPEGTHVRAADQEPRSPAPAPPLKTSEQAFAPSQPLSEPTREALSAPPESARAVGEALHPDLGGGPSGFGEMLGRMQHELRALRPPDPASEPPAPGIQAGERQAAAFEVQPPQAGEAPADAPAPASHPAGPGQPEAGGSPPVPSALSKRSGEADRQAADDTDYPAGAFPQASQPSRPSAPRPLAVEAGAAADQLSQPGAPSNPDAPAPPAKPPAAPRPALRVRRAAPAGRDRSDQPAPRLPAAGKPPQPAAAPPSAGPETLPAPAAALETPARPHAWPAPDEDRPRSTPEDAPTPPHSAPMPQPAAPLRPPGQARARPAGEDTPGAAPVPDALPPAVAAPPPAAARLTIKAPPAVMPDSDEQPEVQALAKPRRAAQTDAGPPVPDAPAAEQDPVYPVWSQSEAIPPQWPEPTDAHWPDLPAPAAERPPLPRQFQDPLRRQRLDREQGGALWNE